MCVCVCVWVHGLVQAGKAKSTGCVSSLTGNVSGISSDHTCGAGKLQLVLLHVPCRGSRGLRI